MAMISRSGLEFCEPSEKAEIRGGKLERRFSLPTHGISLLEIRKEA